MKLFSEIYSTYYSITEKILKRHTVTKAEIADLFDLLTIHNLAGDVQPIELYDAIMQADAMGKIALDK